MFSVLMQILGDADVLNFRDNYTSNDTIDTSDKQTTRFNHLF